MRITTVYIVACPQKVETLKNYKDALFKKVNITLNCQHENLLLKEITLKIMKHCQTQKFKKPITIIKYLVAK